tara:strand:+ start:876 stop:1478 length:603 start_codon:yes stop_codon:yes gene_type:complete
MKKIKIKSYHGAGWLAPILGNDFKKLKKYCEEWDETIEHFCPSANEMKYQEFIDGFDVFSWALDGEDYSLHSFRMLTDGLELFIDQDGSETPIPFDQCTINKSLITEDDFKKYKKDKLAEGEGRAYTFGYSSDEIIDVEFCIDDTIKFDPKKLVITVVENEMFDIVGPYITEIEYNGEYIICDVEDFEGEYYSMNSFKLS